MLQKVLRGSMGSLYKGANPIFEGLKHLPKVHVLLPSLLEGLGFQHVNCRGGHKQMITRLKIKPLTKTIKSYIVDP